jgi:hypothetical protein
MRQRRKTQAAPTPPAQGGSLLTLILLAAVGFFGWQQYSGGGGAAPVVPVPVVPGVNPAAAVFPTIAKLQAENYEKAAARLLAGETVVAVNTDLVALNKAAIEAGFRPLDEHFVLVLTDKTPAETAAVYAATAKEIRRAF